MDVDALIMSMGCRASQKLKPPFEWLKTKGYNTRMKQHSAAFSILEVLGIDADWSSDTPVFTATLLRDLTQEKLYRKFGFTRSMGTIKDLRDLIASGKSDPLMLHFLAQYFGTSIITISQFNIICFYSGKLGAAAQFRDVILLKEMDTPGHFTTCVDCKGRGLHTFSDMKKLLTQSQSTFEKLPSLLDASQFVSIPCVNGTDTSKNKTVNDKMLLKMKWIKLSELATNHGIKSYEKKKNGNGEKKRTKASLIQDLLDADITMIAV